MQNCSRSIVVKQSEQPILARIYQDRARLHDRLGNTDKAAADRKKAQSMSKSFYADVLERKKEAKHP